MEIGVKSGIGNLRVFYKPEKAVYYEDNLINLTNKHMGPRGEKFNPQELEYLRQKDEDFARAGYAEHNQLAPQDQAKGPSQNEAAYLKQKNEDIEKAGYGEHNQPQENRKSSDQLASENRDKDRINEIDEQLAREGGSFR